MKPEIQEVADSINMLEPSNYNALEVYPLYDTIMISESVSQLYTKAQWFDNYQDLAVPTELPFFNVRNIGVVDLAYCNLESSEKLPFPYHICAMGVYVSAPIISSWEVGSTQAGTMNETKAANLFFQTEIGRFSSINLRLGSDDKYLSKVGMMASGHGVSGWVKTLDTAANIVGGAVGNLNIGVAHRKNITVFPEPISVPRDRNMSCQITMAKYLRDALAKANGPGLLLNSNDVEADYDPYPAASIIRVVLGGFREVQLRNNLRFA